MIATPVDPVNAKDAVAAGRAASPVFLRWTNQVRVAVNALLTGSATTGGFLLPRLTTTERNAIAAPTSGETIFNVTTVKAQVWNGAAWQDLN